MFFIFLKAILNQNRNAFNTKIQHLRKDRKYSYAVIEAFALFQNLIALTLD